MNQNSKMAPSGEVSLRVIRDTEEAVFTHAFKPKGPKAVIYSLAKAIAAGIMRDKRPTEAFWIYSLIQRIQHGERLPVGLRVALAKKLGMGGLHSSLSLKRYEPRRALAAKHPERWQRLRDLIPTGVDVGELAREFGGHITEYGVVCRRLVTNDGVAYLAADFAGGAAPDINLYRFHGVGIGTTGALVTDSGLETELVAGDLVGGARATGSQEVNVNIYTTIGTAQILANGPHAITEHGILDVAALGAASLWDRHTFTAKNLDNDDSLQATYDLTCTPGG